MTVDELVHDLVGRGVLTGATLSKPRRSDPARARRVTIRPVLLRGELRYGWTYHETGRATQENLSADETERRLAHVLGGEFRQGLLHAREADFQVLGGQKVLRRPPTRPATPLEHDRRKRYVLEEGVPVPFLVELGVMSPVGKVIARRFGKFRQVNRFLELVGDVLPALPAGRLRVVDFGSGKSSLTFALHHFLRAGHGRDVEILGLDLKEEVVARCEELARTLDAEGLRFEVGDIAGHTGIEPPDLVVSLHACDTATDAALARAVRWETAAILAVPCCQHELLPQLENAELGPLLRHGVLRERFAADVTDAVRAQLLTLAGYDVQLVEFVETEHTPKNILIRAIRRPRGDRTRAAREYAAFKAALGIDPYLERALADVLPLAA